MLGIEVCLQDLPHSDRRIDIGGTWGNAFAWDLSQHNVKIIESRPAAHYLTYNRFMPPEVIRYFFKNIMGIMFQSCDYLKGRIFVPIFDGAEPLAEGLPDSVDQVIIRCKRDHTNGQWEAKGEIVVENITFKYRIRKEGRKTNRIRIEIAILDECAASGSSLKSALTIVINYCIEHAKMLLDSGFDEVSININIVGIWFSQKAIERTEKYYFDFCQNWEEHPKYDNRINFEPLGPFVLAMGISELTEASDIYGPETGLPLDHSNTIVSRQFQHIAEQVSQKTSICAVGDVGLSIGNAKPTYKDGRPTHDFEWHYGHRACGFEEAKHFEIDITKDPWAKELPIIWNLKGNLAIPSFQKFLRESHPELYEYFASLYGSNIEPSKTNVPLDLARVI